MKKQNWEIAPRLTSHDEQLIGMRRFRNIVEAEAEASTYEWVDLGLPSGLLWASCNLGATKPEESGLYFAWGETQGYSDEDFKNGIKQFTWEDYKWGSDIRNLTKYVDQYGYLYPEDDAAFQYDFLSYIPSEQTFYELYDNCTWEYETLNNVDGIRFISKINNNSIFFPFCGIYIDGEKVGVGTETHLWACEHNKNYWAAFSPIVKDDSPIKGIYWLDRCRGYSIRPISMPSND